MQRYRYRALTLTIALLTSSLYAQNRDEKRNDLSGFRFSSSVNLVHLAVTVVNRRGGLVTDLAPKEFRLFEDDVPQEIEYFASSIDSPVDVMVLVDASGSMEMVSKVTNARQAAAQLIQTLAPEDRVSVYAFTKTLTELCPFTENKREALEALDRLEPFGSTALYDAVAQASDSLQHLGFGRRAIVVLTDGVDTSSELTVAEAVEVASRVELPVYVVRVLSPLDDPESDAYLGIHGSQAKGEDALSNFTAQTGGRLYQGSDTEALLVMAFRIKEELKTQYHLAYNPSNARWDGRFRRIQVEIARSRVEVRTRRGYFAPRRKTDRPDVRGRRPDSAALEEAER